MIDQLGLLMQGRRFKAAEAAKEWRHEPGIYAMFVDEPAALPEPYAAVLRARNSTLIYIGKAADSLLRRGYEQEMRHRNAATFFRSLGAVLGYLPPRGSLIGKANQRNYRFSNEDTARIVAWIDAHLTASILPVLGDGIEEVERAVIIAARPLLNIQNNPDALPELSAARARCVAVAVEAAT